MNSILRRYAMRRSNTTPYNHHQIISLIDYIQKIYGCDNVSDESVMDIASFALDLASVSNRNPRRAVYEMWKTGHGVYSFGDLGDE